MSLSAIDCIGRGVANLRANWELVLLQVAQTVVCAVTTVVGVVGVVMLLGASFLFQVKDLKDWTAALEQLEGLSLGWGLVVIGLAALTILLTVVGLVYCWFQAGIVTTLDRGERQAPRPPANEPQLFRTFSGRNFIGWSNSGAWRYFSFISLLGLFVSVIFGLYAVAAVIAVAAMGESGGAGMAVVGCLAFLPLVPLALFLNLWFLVGLALLAREEFSVWRATQDSLRILWSRLGGAALIAVLFVIASLGVGLVFWPLGQGMATALKGSIPAWFAVQFLLTVAQWLVNGILTVALFASAIALVRTELDRTVA